MNKALLTIVCAASMSAYAMAATPVDLTVEVGSGSTVETLQDFTLKFMRGGSLWVGMNDGNVTINPENKIQVKGSSETYTAATQLCVWGSLITVHLDQKILRPGEYEVIVPEGCVSYNGECNKETKTKITVTGSSVGMTQNEWMQYFVMDPQDGASLTSLGSFTLVGSTPLENLSVYDASLKAPDGKIYYSAPDFLADKTQAQYRFSAPSDVAGPYVLTIPERTLSANLPGLGETANPELVFRYTLKTIQGDLAPVEVDLAVSPLNTVTEGESFSSFFIKVTDGDDILGPFTIDSKLLDKVVIQSATSSYRASAVVNVDGDPSTIEVKFANPVTAGGTYSITLPEGLLGWERFTNTELTLEDAFKCTGEVVDYFSKLTWYRGSVWSQRIPVDANFEVESIGSLFGTFDNIPANASLTIPTEGSGEDEIGSSRAVIKLPSGEAFTRVISPVTYDNHSFKIAINFDGLYREEGAYTVTIPAGALIVNGNSNPEIEQVFTIADKTVYTPVDLNLRSNPDPNIILDELSYISWTTSIVDDEYKDLYRIIGVKPNSKITVAPKGGTPFEVPVENYPLSYEDGFAIDLKPDITTTGEYVVTIPEGIYRLYRYSDDKYICNEAATYTYTVKNDGPVVPKVLPSVSPTPGEVASLATIEFFRPTGYTMYIPDPVKPFTLTLPDGSGVQVNPTTNANVEGDYIFVYLPEKYTTPGQYTLSIPDGGILLYDAADQPVSFPGYSYTYTVKEFTASKLAYTADPVDGSSIYSPLYVYVKFDDTVTYTDGVKAKLTTPAGETEEVITSFNKANNRLMLTFGYMNYSLYGEYKFTIPQGIVVTADGRTNEEFTLTYNYIERKIENIPFIITPKEGLVAEFQRVTIEGPEGCKSIGRQDHDNTKLEIVIDKRNGDEIKKNLYVRMGASENIVYVELDQPLTVSNDADKYDITLTIPEGIFTIYMENGEELLNAATRLSWRFDKNGVAEILGENGLFNVFTLDGKCLYRDADANVLDTLSEGMYIINGKTVIIR